MAKDASIIGEYRGYQVKLDTAPTVNMTLTVTSPPIPTNDNIPVDDEFPLNKMVTPERIERFLTSRHLPNMLQGAITAESKGQKFC